MSRRVIVDWVVLVVVGLLSWFAYTNQQDIRDWWTLRNYQAPAEISALAEATAMSELGERRFYASQPQLNDRTNFNQNCPFPERTMVLGCYAAGRIYIFEVENEALDGIEEVTAAHEMLHAAYERLSNSEREKVDSMTASFFAASTDERLQETIEGYRQDDPGSVPNELHSILGTEVRELQPELEAYYAQYFEDRSRVVALAEAYEQVFDKLQDQIDELAGRISELRQSIENAESQLSVQRNALDTEFDNLTNLRESGDIEAYNAAVPGYNAQVEAYNQLVNDYVGWVKEHNELVAEHNQLALQQNQLIQSLDSNFDPI